MRKITAFLIITIAISLNACSKSQNNSSPKSRDKIQIDLGGDVATLDPQSLVDFYSFRVISDLDEGIIDMDQANRPIPGMAESWNISSDGKTYIFHLRHDLKFSDGSTINAADFVYSWQRLVNPKTGGYAFILDHVINAKAIQDGGKAPEALGVTALDPYTLKVQLALPDPAFLAKLTAVFSAPVPRKTITQYGESWTTVQHIVTCGAYTLTSRIVNGQITLTKNPYYYAANMVSIPTIEFIPYSDRNSALSAYKAGNLDILSELPIDQYQTIKQQFPAELHNVKMEGIVFYSLNTRLPQLQDVRLRQTLSMAIDRQTLTGDVLRGGQTPLYSLITPTIENSRYSNLDYSWKNLAPAQRIDYARKLYQQAGYSAESPLQLSIIYDNNDISRKIALAVASMWREQLGITTTLRVEDWKSYLQSRKQGAFVIIRNSWGAAYNMISTYTPEYQCNSTVNVGGWCSPAYDRLIAKAESEQNHTRQTQLYQQAITLAMESYPIIPLYQNNYTLLIKPYIGGLNVESNLLDDIRSKWLYLK